MKFRLCHSLCAITMWTSTGPTPNDGMTVRLHLCIRETYNNVNILATIMQYQEKVKK